MSTITISADGTVKFIYSDTLIGMEDLGPLRIRRASNVEPTPDGHWTADMKLSNGPVLGPFRLRCDALAAEHEWLEDHMN